MSAMRSMPADAGLLSLQQEALQRVRQMQQRARLAVEGSAEPPFPTGGPGGGEPPAAPAFSQPPAAAAPEAAAASQRQAVPPNAPPQPQGQRPRQASQPQQDQRQPNGGQSSHPPPFSGPRQRPSGPESILSQLFGGGRPPPQRRQGGPRPNSPAGHAGGGGGLLDLIRGGLGGGDASGLGETLRGSIASASKPLSDLLDAFSIDGDKLLILLVMWVIFNERSDNKTLLLALGYLLL